MGLLVLRFLAGNVVQFEGFVAPRSSSDLPASLLFGSLFAFVLFGEVVRRGIGPRWARPAQITLVATMFGVMAIDLVWYGDWWGPPMGLLVFVVIVYPWLTSGCRSSWRLPSRHPVERCAPFPTCWGRSSTFKRWRRNETFSSPPWIGGKHGSGNV